MRIMASTPTLRRGDRRRRSGVTLAELLVSLVLFAIVFGAAIPFVRFQSRAVGASAGRQDALQNARFAQDAIDREIRMAGAGVVPKQPTIVQADRFAVTFNADLATADSMDPSAMYYDPSVDSNATISMTTAAKVVLPLSARSYPDSNYAANSISSRAETIAFWVAPDSSPGHTGLYILYRRVNNMPARILTRGLSIGANQSFFTYLRVDSAGRLDSIRTSSLPLYHNAAIHGSLADTGRLAWVDSIRAVRVLASGSYADPDRGNVVRIVQGSTKLMNATMVRAITCGDQPLPASGAVATPSPAVNPTKIVITWTASLDQDNGEKDVERYMVFKRASSDPDWGEPRASVGAGQSSYTINDTDLRSGTWLWAVVAQDCSPQNSALATTNSVILP
jgi:type II secretory pathway pseudopilin PulG